MEGGRYCLPCKAMHAQQASDSNDSINQPEKWYTHFLCLDTASTNAKYTSLHMRDIDLV